MVVESTGNIFKDNRNKHYGCQWNLVKDDDNADGDADASDLDSDVDDYDGNAEVG